MDLRHRVRFRIELATLSIAGSSHHLTLTLRVLRKSSSLVSLGDLWVICADMTWVILTSPFHRSLSSFFYVWMYVKPGFLCMVFKWGTLTYSVITIRNNSWQLVWNPFLNHNVFSMSRLMLAKEFLPAWEGTNFPWLSCSRPRLFSDKELWSRKKHKQTKTKELHSQVSWLISPPAFWSIGV